MKTDDTLAQVEEPSDRTADIDLASSARSVPLCNWRAHWLTVAEFSRLMGYHPQTVYWWLRNNTLAEFGIPTMQFRGTRSHCSRSFILNIY
jgi:hypothetical protein